MENERGKQIGEESVRDENRDRKKIEKLRVDEEGKCNYEKDGMDGERRERWIIEGVDRKWKKLWENCN